MTIKERTFIFNVIVNIFNIIIGLAIEGALLACLFYILPKIPNSENSIPTQVILPFLLFAGLIIAMLISIKFVAWTIRRFDLYDKIDPKIIKKYIHDQEK